MKREGPWCHLAFQLLQKTKLCHVQNLFFLSNSIFERATLGLGEYVDFDSRLYHELEIEIISNTTVIALSGTARS